MPPKRMTANPIKPARYRPGKPVAEEPSSEEEEDDEDKATPAATPPPKATSFPSDATKIAANLKQVDLNERKRKAALEEAKRLEAEEAARAKEEEGFVTEESEEEEGTDDDEEESGSGSEESSSEEEAPKLHLRPTFIKKDKREKGAIASATKTEDEIWAEEEARRKEKADAMIQEQLEKNAAAQAAGKKNWDDDEDEEADQVDDTDDLDPETERAAWKLRELKRVKREREAIEIAEKEREEIERRRNLSREEREAEDKEFLDKQKEEREGKGKMGFMQKYFHKGAFFQDDSKAEGLDQRDIMGSRYQDDVTNRELLPQYMQIRDMAKLGRKGRTKYKDLKSEDTGRWGVANADRPRRTDTGVVDERFMPDKPNREKGASGANTTEVRPRRTAPEGAPQGPRATTTTDRADPRPGGDTYRPRDNDDDDHEHRNEQYSKATPSSRRRSPYPNDNDDRGESRRNDDTYRREDDERRGHYPNGRRRRRSYSRSRSRSTSRRRDRYGEDRSRRKRSPSPYRDRDRDRGRDRDGSDKRRRVDVT